MIIGGHSFSLKKVPLSYPLKPLPNQRFKDFTQWKDPAFPNEKRPTAIFNKGATITHDARLSGEDPFLLIKKFHWHIQQPLENVNKKFFFSPEKQALSPLNSYFYRHVAPNRLVEFGQ